LPISDWLVVKEKSSTGKTMNADDLKRRTKQFALRILKLVAALPNTVQGRTVGGQLARAGTSVGANYRAARRGRSKAEFIAKIGVVEEEADESGYWLELFIEGGLLKEQLVEPLLDEANELTKIMGRSRITAFNRSRAERQSAIVTRRSKTSNRQSAIGNRQ
jgi:four helix bundle protein